MEGKDQEERRIRNLICIDNNQNQNQNQNQTAERDQMGIGKAMRTGLKIGSERNRTGVDLGLGLAREEEGGYIDR